MAKVKPIVKKNVAAIVANGLLGKYFNLQNPIWIDFRITYKCNLRCGYCDLPSINMPEMTTHEVKKVIDKIDAPGRVILLTGGEPLVRKDIGEVVDHFVFNSRMKVRLNTNLLLMKKKYDEIKYCDGFYFSLDGSKKTHEFNKGAGSWKGVEEGLEILHADRRGKISMTVITAETKMDDIKFVLDTCAKYEILPAFQLVRHYEHSKSSEDLAPDMKNAIEIFEYLKKERLNGYTMMNSTKGLQGQIDLAKNSLKANCYSGKLLCTVDSDGMVGLCFSRPRSKHFLSLTDENVSFKEALKALNKVKPHTNRCNGCTCMAPIEFSRATLFNMDVMRNNYESDKKFAALEEGFTKRLNDTAAQ